jgi:cation transport ATPase
MVLVNAVPGRLRVRSHSLRHRKFAENVEAELRATTGVNDVRLNRAASSIVVYYDPSRVEEEALENRLESLCVERQARVARTRKTLDRQVNLASKIGMGATLAGVVGTAYFGSKKTHEQLGWGFLAFTAYHLLRNRGTLLR